MMNSDIKKGDIVEVWHMGIRIDPVAVDDHDLVGKGVILKITNRAYHVYLNSNISIFRKKYFRLSKVC